MIIITGAAGFIGSCVAQWLNQSRYYDLVLSDDFSRKDKVGNWLSLRYTAIVDRNELVRMLDLWPADRIECIIHLGARTDTTERNTSLFDELNFNYSKSIWDFCVREQIPLIYASSAATYGDGSLGFSDETINPGALKPLNAYALSKQQFDLYAYNAESQPFFWAGLKFFNVYGPNEYHKGRMASVVFHAFHQVRVQQKIQLFQSHRPDYTDGGQLRDFIYVTDVCKVIQHLMENRPASGIYNLGTGKARTFADLGKAVFDAMGMPVNIEYIPMPEDIRHSYQYYTQAEMNKLKTIGQYPHDFMSLEEGVKTYIQQHLMPLYTNKII